MAGAMRSDLRRWGVSIAPTIHFTPTPANSVLTPRTWLPWRPVEVELDLTCPQLRQIESRAALPQHVSHRSTPLHFERRHVPRLPAELHADGMNRTRHRRLPGPRMEPPAGCPRGRLYTRAPSRPRRGSPSSAGPPRAGAAKTKPAHRGPLSPARAADAPHRGRRQDWRTKLMRRAALAQFGWRRDEAKEGWIPKAPWEISGRDSDGKPLRDPSHAHAFWLPEDADGDGWIDHVSVFIAGGMNDDIRAKLDRITRLWLAPKQRSEDVDAEPGSVKEWRLALEGFGDRPISPAARASSPRPTGGGA